MNPVCKIVMYHYVRPIKKSKYPKIKGLEVKHFVKQIQYFKNNYNFISSKQLIDCLYKKYKIPQNSVLLTFDDGFKDHYSYVFPVLKKFKIQGLFFPSAKPIEKHIVLDVHKIHFILNSTSLDTILKEIFSFISKNRSKYDLQTPEWYFSKLAVPNRYDEKEVIFIKRILQRELPAYLRSKITNYLFEKYVTLDETSFSKELYLSREEITEMKESGMYFGSHGYSHKWLSHLSRSELKSEIKNSLNFCYKININNSEMIMCYPYGDYNDEIIEELKKEGFIAGLTTRPGNALLTKSQAFILKRYDANDFAN